jgi:hypothetical protein
VPVSLISTGMRSRNSRVCMSRPPHCGTPLAACADDVGVRRGERQHAVEIVLRRAHRQHHRSAVALADAALAAGPAERRGDALPGERRDRTHWPCPPRRAVRIDPRRHLQDRRLAVAGHPRQRRPILALREVAHRAGDAVLGRHRRAVRGFADDRLTAGSRLAPSSARRTSSGLVGAIWNIIWRARCEP